jgi:hypothetical protein
MRRSLAIALTILTLAAALPSCRPYVGSRLYPGTPRFAKTHPEHVMLIERRPRKDHIELGQVWIRPDPWMDRYFVEYKLRKKAAKMGADAVIIVEDKEFRNRVAYRRYGRGTMVYRERFIGGIAIRFR